MHLVRYTQHVGFLRVSALRAVARVWWTPQYLCLRRALFLEHHIHDASLLRCRLHNNPYLRLRYLWFEGLEGYLKDGKHLGRVVIKYVHSPSATNLREHTITKFQKLSSCSWRLRARTWSIMIKFLLDLLALLAPRVLKVSGQPLSASFFSSTLFSFFQRRCIALKPRNPVPARAVILLETIVLIGPLVFLLSPLHALASSWCNFSKGLAWSDWTARYFGILLCYSRKFSLSPMSLTDMTGK